MKVTGNNWNDFWKFIEHVNNYKIALPHEGEMHISYNPYDDKVDFVNKLTGQKGELVKEDVKRLFGKHVGVT